MGKLINELTDLGIGIDVVIGTAGALNTLNENVVNHRIRWSNSSVYCLIGVLACREFDIRTKEFIEIFRGSWNGIPKCSVYYRMIDNENIEIKAVRIKGE